MRRLLHLALNCWAGRTFARVTILSTLALPGGSLAAFAQPSNANPFTINLGGGASLPSGKYAQGLDKRYSLDVGAGFGLIRQDEEFLQRRWSLYLTGDFMFNPASVNPGSVVDTVGLNPQTPSLLAATAGKENLYSFTLGPTFRLPRWHAEGRWPVGVYVIAGFGGLHRSVDFTGLPVEGTVLQSSSPVVYRVSGTSGAFNVGTGANIGRFGSVGNMMLYLEFRAVHGLGINSGTTWAPIFGFRW